MRVRIVRKSVIDKIVLPDAHLINQGMLADRLGVTKSMVHYGLSTGNWPEKYLPALRAIKLIEVVGTRKNLLNKTTKTKGGDGNGKAGKKVAAGSTDRKRTA